MKLSLYFKSKANGEGKINVTIDHANTQKERSKLAHAELKKKGLTHIIGTVQRIEVKNDYR